MRKTRQKLIIYAGHNLLNYENFFCFTRRKVEVAIQFYWFCASNFFLQGLNRKILSGWEIPPFDITLWKLQKVCLTNRARNFFLAVKKLLFGTQNKFFGLFSPKTN
jgi:hypothetical protein